MTNPDQSGNARVPAICPALFITAPASGQGKTTVTAALARSLREAGKSVRVFKTGPDYLDPQILEQASGQPVEPLDLWMAGENYCRQKLFEAAQCADLILIEGAMGMYDGSPSSADLAAKFDIPMVIVMNVKGMAQTVAPLVSGLSGFRDDVSVVGLIANHCGSEHHARLIRESLPESVHLLGVFPRDPDLALPERHLGLVQAHEVSAELERRFQVGVEALHKGGVPHQFLRGLQKNCKESGWVFPDVEFYPAEAEYQDHQYERQLQGLRVGIARDEAFSFIYTANIELLQKLGAQCEYFSPLSDSKLDDYDAVWLPGGYPELHAQALAENHAMKLALKRFFDRGKPILAECGGFLYCLETLVDLDGNTHPMLGILAGEASMRGKRGCQGMQTAPLPEGHVRGHAHHRSRTDHTPEPFCYGIRQRHLAPGEPVYRIGGLTATYLHLFFPSNPEAIARLFSGSMAIDKIEEPYHVV